ncbi:MAG: phosphoglucosamine mutase [Verrucomicrobiales bacterium]|nr:phosphoglucosamine mutase [Verrucomicrobiales bacterium]
MNHKERILFGTDGIRGKAGLYPLNAATVLKLGQAAADVLLSESDSSDWPLVVIGKDTRQSGDMLETAIAAGLNSRGVDVRLAGVIPTPAIAFLTRDLGAAFGIVISASHNPFEDNGIKFFGPDGYKLDDDVELAIEERLLETDTPQDSEKIGRTASLEDAAERYIHFVTHGNESGLLAGMTIALDAANGAAYQTSPAILKALGAEVITFHDTPSGLNINNDCGCTHSEIIENLVKETGATAGVSHDGDADRVLLADENGKVLDGDELMAIAAISMLAEGTLRNNTLVTTVMSNAGLDKAVKEAGGQVLRTNVGDRYVVEAMKAGDHNFGGEQSGHFIFRDHNTTGDGIVSAVQLLSIVRQSGKPLSELRKMLERFPQVQRNVRVSRKPDLKTVESIDRHVVETVETLGDGGRVLMRYSGTEPLLRILVEGQDMNYIETQIDKIAAAAKEAIGE